MLHHPTNWPLEAWQSGILNSLDLYRAFTLISHNLV